nr:MAG TPA: hypothetical protein [Caudoviricetes sp.]
MYALYLLVLWNRYGFLMFCSPINKTKHTRC